MFSFLDSKIESRVPRFWTYRVNQLAPHLFILGTCVLSGELFDVFIFKPSQYLISLRLKEVHVFIIP